MPTCSCGHWRYTSDPLRRGPASVVMINILNRQHKGQILCEDTHDIIALEMDIDRLVYELYDLTADEIAIVEGSTRAK